MGRPRRRAAIARNGITQILETAAEYGFQGEEWMSLARDCRNVAKALRKVERSEEMALGVESLERRQRQARERLETLLFSAPEAAPEAVNSGPLGPESEPHQYTYKPNPNPKTDTVMADEARTSRAETTVPDQATPRQSAGQQRSKTREAGADRRDGAAAIDRRARASPWAGKRQRLRWRSSRRSRRVISGPRRGVFPRHGGEGEGRGAGPGADDLGLARDRPTGRGGAFPAPAKLMAAQVRPPEITPWRKACHTARPTEVIHLQHVFQ